MLLRSKQFLCPIYKVSQRLLSNEFKEVLNTRLDTPNGSNGNQIHLSVLTKNLNGLNLDFFVNNLDEHDDRSSLVLDLLSNLRATKLANTCLDSTHFAVVRHLLENLTIQEIVPVLVDRPKYGIFLNNFTGFAVFHSLHEQKEYILGLPLAVKLISAAEIDSAFIQGFCLKAALETLKRDLFKEQPSSTENVSKPKGKVQEKKIRVKYLRNPYVPDVYNEIGRAILKVSGKLLEGDNKVNIDILGFILTKNYTKLENALCVNSIEINADIADICNALLLRENQTDFSNKVDKLRSKSLFETFIDEFLKEVCIKEPDVLAKKQKQLMPIWQQIRAEEKTKYDYEMAKEERIGNIEAMKNEITTKKELLWFFDNEDKVDLEIFKKEELYPKRSLDKNKKPCDIDENYVPPQIRKID